MPGNDPPRIGYAVHSMQIEYLKNLKNLDEISFEDEPITGIFGPNCCGKSTVLHALIVMVEDIQHTKEIPMQTEVMT